MLFVFFITIIAMCALMIAALAIHMRIRSGETRPTVKYDQMHRAHIHKLHNVIFSDDPEDERVALPA